jgi:tetratricopeptide (TPR) repeat protein
MFRKALEICESHDRQIGAAACYHGLGTVYRSQDRLVEAEQMFRKALECEEAIDRREGMAACYTSLAVIHDHQRNRDKANVMRTSAGCCASTIEPRRRTAQGPLVYPNRRSAENLDSTTNPRRKHGNIPL